MWNICGCFVEDMRKINVKYLTTYKQDGTKGNVCCWQNVLRWNVV